MGGWYFSSTARLHLKPCDLYRDLFAVIVNDSLLPSELHFPANYEPQKPQLLEEDCTVNHICDFVVEYINSDVLVRGRCAILILLFD